MITIRKSVLNDNKDFAELMLISAPYFPILFGYKIKAVLQDLFCYRSNLFGFEHAYFAEVDGEKAGMILGYDWETKRRENLKTGFLLFKKIGVNILGKFLLLMKFNITVGKMYNNEYYISNIAVYSQHRGKGIGKKLIFEAEQEAKIIGAKRAVLDVEKENVSAVNFYRKLGYKVIKEFSISLKKDRILHFFRMVREISGI